MSLTLTLTGRNSVLAVNYFSALDLSDSEYDLGLTNFETYNTIPNVTSSNNEFHFDTNDITITIPEESEESVLILRANENTMRSEIKCEYLVDFSKTNSIGSLLGFSTSRVLRPNKWHASDELVEIMNVNIIRVECNITSGEYNNDRPAHTIHEFAANVPPGYKLSVTPTHVIYLPVIARNITDITIRVVDQNGQLIDFRGEEISIRLHI
ncbi:hypothetical protein ALC62_08624 [Cyphomyrmex costatus]|uniref:Uncharacterized protein n=1 Tax=Cyphomyrmex costatus TaxID=456900 RepID=A0A151IGQ8_9HYME|nr:hypothetical protein ALC62_08624 [Cyphomyrmex costatus]